MNEFLKLVNLDGRITNRVGPGGKRSEKTEVTPSVGSTNILLGEAPHEKRFIQAVVAAIGGFLAGWRHYSEGPRWAQQNSQS